MSLFGVREDHSYKSQSLDDLMVKNKVATFYFQATGDAMAPKIEDGDILVVDRSKTAVSNSIVIVAIDGVLLCRRLIYQKNVPYFVSDNYDEWAEAKGDGEEMVWGVVTFVIKRTY